MQFCFIFFFFWVLGFLLLLLCFFGGMGGGYILSDYQPEEISTLRKQTLLLYCLLQQET